MFPLSVPNARPRPIDDATLQTLTRVGHDAARGLCTPAEAEWLLSCSGVLLDELTKRRAAMAHLPALVEASNVVALPGAR